jgi:hypothetical protein
MSTNLPDGFSEYQQMLSTLPRLYMYALFWEGNIYIYLFIYLFIYICTYIKMEQKQAPVVGRTGAAPVVIEVTGEGPESNLTLATSTSRLWCRRRLTRGMKKLSAEEKSPQGQHAVNGDSE